MRVILEVVLHNSVKRKYFKDFMAGVAKKAVFSLLLQLVSTFSPEADYTFHVL